MHAPCQTPVGVRERGQRAWNSAVKAAPDFFADHGAVPVVNHRIGERREGIAANTGRVFPRKACFSPAW